MEHLILSLIYLPLQLILKVSHSLLQTYLDIWICQHAQLGLFCLFELSLELVYINLSVLFNTFLGQECLIYFVSDQLVFYQQKLQVFLELNNLCFYFDSFEAVRVCNSFNLGWVYKLHPDCNILFFHYQQLVRHHFEINVL